MGESLGSLETSPNRKETSMKIFATLFSILLLVLLVPGALAESATTLDGEFVWDQGGYSGDLEAVFTETGEGHYDVEFHFHFNDRDHVYAGTAEGSLTLGALEGKVFSEDKRRTFLFEGTVAGGKFEGTHAEILDKGEISTGTLSLGG
jgi:hypothetical protein